MFCAIKLRSTYTHTLGNTRLEEQSACRRGVELHNTEKSQETYNHISVGFQPATPACKRPQTYTLERTANGIIDQLLRK
jgi:hypothetical protein